MNNFYHSKYAYGRTRPKKEKSRGCRIIRIILLVVLLVLLGFGYYIYRAMFNENTWTPEGEPVSVYIHPGDDFGKVSQRMYSKGLIVNRQTFEWLADKKKYPDNIKPGHYLVKDGMTNNKLINLLRAGIQTPVNVVFHNIRYLPELAETVSNQLLFDSAALMKKIEDTAYLHQLGFDTLAVKTMFIPNTYEFYWTSTPTDFMERMKKEFDKFWSDDKLKKAEKMDYTPIEVITLASIIEKETNRDDEMSRIAGVYINRLERGWRLQADPTLKFALKDFSIRRVLNKHKQIESPYNTYKNRGLPPGPICLPSITAIESVLNYEDHKYLYFVAKSDFSGYHSFSRTYKKHIQKAREYQRALNKKQIYN